MLPVFALLLPVAGGLLALGSHLAFLFRLRAVQPDLFRTYWQIAFRFASTHIRSYLLSQQVFTRITDLRALRLHRFDVICFRLFAGSLVVAVLVFALPRLLALR